jgi:hypothetical protein
VKLRFKTSRQQAGRTLALSRDWIDSLPNHPRRWRRRSGGRMEPLKRPDAAMRKPAKVAIVTGVNSRAVRGELDQRFAFAKATSTYTEEYRQHVGSDRSVVMDDLCRSAARHKAIMNLALARLMERGPLDTKDNIRAAYEAFRKADADHREVIRLLGIQRREKEIPRLGELLHREEAG